MNYSDAVCRALKQARVFTDSEGHSVDSIDISSDGQQVVTSSEDKALRLYDAHDSGTLLKTLHAKKYGVSLVRFAHAPGTVVCATRNEWDNSLRYWSLHDNRYLRYFKGHRAEVVGLCVSPKDDFLLSSSADGTCRLWDVRSGMRSAVFLSACA
jgi:COMPASS component SWD2